MMTDPAASRPGTHLDPDRMVDLFEGLLDPAAADGAREHLATCQMCSADFALITGESDLNGLNGLNGLNNLSELLPPVQIPQDVVTRIEAALYREPPLKVAPAAPTAPTAPAPVGHPAPARRRWSRRFRISLGALAGASLVLAGGIGIVTALNSGNDSMESKGSASSGATSQHADGSRVAGQPPAGGAMSPQYGSAPDSSPAGPRNPDEASIEQQAEALLGLHVATPAIGTGPQCVPEGVAYDAKPLAKTQTQYQGEPAWLLVYAKPGSATLAEVYVVAVNTCTSGNPGPVADHIEITRP